MANRVVEYALDDGTTVSFEIESPAGYHPASAHDVVARVREAAGPAVEAARVVVERARAAAPQEVTVTFGIKVSGTTNWMVAKAATEGNFAIAMTWKHDQAD